MFIEKVTLHHINMPLVTPFVAKGETTSERELIIVEARDKDGVIGWGECSAFASPWYTEETISTAWHILTDFLIPSLLNKRIDHPKDLQNIFSLYKRNQMAKAALELAVWDLYTKRQQIPLSTALGGKKTKIEVGAAVGIQSSEAKLIDTIERFVSEGYKRVKVKIMPGLEDAILYPIREHFPTLPLMVDANSAYTLEQLEQLKRLDAYDLLMIEQPLASDDFVEHAQLQAQLTTPICLDESINSYHDALQAITLKSCKIINIKVAKVGGLTTAKKIHNLCQKENIPVWCGGMLDSGIARAHNLAISTLPNYSLPGDTSASARYWQRDIITPEVTMDKGYIHVPKGVGIGYEVDRKQLSTVTLTTKTIC